MLEPLVGLIKGLIQRGKNYRNYCIVLPVDWNLKYLRSSFNTFIESMRWMPISYSMNNIFTIYYKLKAHDRFVNFFFYNIKTFLEILMNRIALESTSL